MNRHRCLMVVLMCFLGAACATAQDVYIEQTAEMPGMAGQQPTQMPIKIWFTTDKVRIDQPLGGGTSVIMRADLKKMWILNQTAKTCMEQDLEAVKSGGAAAAAMMGGHKMQVDIKATGNAKKVGDWNCQEYLLSVTGGPAITMQVWATPEVPIDPGLYSKMSEIMGSNPMMSSLTEKMKTIQGYPVQTIMKMAMGNQVIETTTTVQKISQDKIDASVFEIPEGFTKTVVPTAPAPGAAPAAPATPEKPAPKKGGS